MTKNRTPTPVYLDPGMHPGLEVKGLKRCYWELNVICKCLVSIPRNMSNFHPLEVVGRDSQTQLQVGEYLPI